MGLELQVSHAVYEPNALEIVRKRLSNLLKKVVELLGAVGVTQRALRKYNQRINRIVTDTW
jgi:hypothetical protein